jgi:uncharacterized protein YciI
LDQETKKALEEHIQWLEDSKRTHQQLREMLISGKMTVGDNGEESQDWIERHQTIIADIDETIKSVLKMIDAA